MYNLLRDLEGLPEFVRKQEFLVGISTHCIAMSSTVCLFDIFVLLVWFGQYLHTSTTRLAGKIVKLVPKDSTDADVSELFSQINPIPGHSVFCSKARNRTNPTGAEIPDIERLKKGGVLIPNL